MESQQKAHAFLAETKGATLKSSIEVVLVSLMEDQKMNSFIIRLNSRYSLLRYETGIKDPEDIVCLKAMRKFSSLTGEW